MFRFRSWRGVFALTLASLTAASAAQGEASGPPPDVVPAATAASSQSAARGTPCVMVFGQGRNFDPSSPSRNRHWDEVNGAYNLATREVLVAGGVPVVTMVLPVAATDVPANVQQLLSEVKRQGCTRVLETAFFADPAANLLIVRVRIYPVLGMVGPQAAETQPRIGPVSFTQQREFGLDARTVARVDPARLGRMMGAEALVALGARPGAASR